MRSDSLESQSHTPELSEGPETLLVGEPKEPRSPARLVAIGSGKGGVGKTFVASSLGIALASRGKRVVLVDADLGGANLHSALGLSRPKVTLSDLIHRRVDSIEDVLTPTGITNLSLVSGAYDYLLAANLKHVRKTRILRQIESLDADFVLLDLGAGLALNVIDFFVLGAPGIVVVSPEPGSIQTGYRFLKVSFYRHLWRSTSSERVRALIAEAMYEKNDRNLSRPEDLMKAALELNDMAGSSLKHAARTFRPWLIVNQVRTIEDRRLGPTLAGICYTHLGIDIECQHPIFYEDRVWQANRSMKPYCLAVPSAPAARNLRRIAGSLLLPRSSLSA